MRPLLLVPYYIRWHYGKALQSSIRIIANLLWFTGHLFSIGILFKTLFSPWQRIQEEKKPNSTFEDILGNMVVNMLMRMAGGIIRLVVIGMGLITMALIFAVGILFFILWLAFPVCIVVFFLLGIAFLFK